MTIDEAIARARNISDKNSNCWMKCRSKLCKDCMQEHEQIIEWLEELKALRHEANEWRKAGYAHGHSDGYNKAIDEACEYLKCEWSVDNLHSCDDFDKIAEQLKAGVENEK